MAYGNHSRNPAEANIPAIILAGGFGTRLRDVCSSVPKPMIPVRGRPFLDYLVEYISREGIRDIFISCGYLGEQIESFFNGERHGARIRCIREPKPMGTGGALAYVADRIGLRGYFLACNGDSIAPFHLEELISSVQSGADAAIVSVGVSDRSRFGTVTVDLDGMMTRLAEKSAGAAEAVINAGIYFLPASLLPTGPEIRPASMERDYFADWLLERKRIAVVSSNGPFIDIGTPESLAAAAEFVRVCGLFPLLA